MTEIDFSTSDEINITSDGECCMHVSSFRRRVRGAAGPVSSSAFASARFADRGEELIASPAFFGAAAVGEGGNNRLSLVFNVD